MAESIKWKLSKTPSGRSTPMEKIGNKPELWIVSGVGERDQKSKCKMSLHVIIMGDVMETLQFIRIAIILTLETLVILDSNKVETLRTA